jgi:predicted amidohydrolase
VTERLRVASLQYFIRPVLAFDQFADQVRSLVETAADYKSRFVVFPEYFTVQLLTLGNVKRPMVEQARELALQAPRVAELLTELARRHRLYIVGGSIPVLGDDDRLYNQCLVVGPQGKLGFQRKLHMTRWENDEWKVSPGERLKIFDADFGRFAVNICYDVQFPELARAAARAGATLLVVPSCTDDRQGFLRVRYCAHARCIENQLFAVHSCTVGSLPMVPAVSLNYGQASVLTPSDFGFSRDGILAEGVANQESLIVGDLNLAAALEARERGTVLSLRDSVASAEFATRLEVVEV